jgi:hypothetical protein
MVAGWADFNRRGGSCLAQAPIADRRSRWAGCRRCRCSSALSAATRSQRCSSRFGDEAVPAALPFGSGAFAIAASAKASRDNDGRAAGRFRACGGAQERSPSSNREVHHASVAGGVDVGVAERLSAGLGRAGAWRGSIGRAGSAGRPRVRARALSDPAERTLRLAAGHPGPMAGPGCGASSPMARGRRSGLPQATGWLTAALHSAPNCP